MSHGKSDADIVRSTHNTARFFTENRHVAWVVLVATVVWGIFGYFRMPQRKDPDIPIRSALAICAWPGVSAEKVEQLVTRRIEEAIAQNIRVDKIESTTRAGVTFVFVTLQQSAPNVPLEFDDIKLKLDAIRDLPDGAGPIDWIKDFGDTTALMLTVASPKIGEVQVSLRARSVQRAIEKARAELPAEASAQRLSLVYWFPPTIPSSTVIRPFRLFVDLATQDGVFRDPKLIEESGFVAVDAASDWDDARILGYGQEFIRTHLRASELHPDVWPPVIIRDPATAEARLAAAAGDKYTYRELEDFTELVKRTLQTIPLVSKVERSGILEERIYLSYSQERLASYGVQPLALRDVLSARNIRIPGGQVEIEGKNLNIAPTGEFKSEKEIGDVMMPMASKGSALYLRDLVEIVRSYQSPPRYLNYYTWRDKAGTWQRTRAVTLSVQMRPGEKIGEFGEEVDEALQILRQRLPEDLIFARTSDQPLQVEENIHLFMSSLIEAVILVVIVGLLGFWEVRSALLLALSIPLTLAMTFGMMSLLGIDLQQISIASLIIALGLLVDDPVVANDAIKRDLALGHRPIVAAWLGPTKLATAILFATITNIVAYLPFLVLPGDMGRFLYSLPIVLTCSLVASRIVSMTFIPLLGYYVLRPSKKPQLPMHVMRTRGFAGRYYKIGTWAIRRRWLVFFASLLFLAGGFALAGKLKTQFMPKDLAYLSYADIWLPEDAPLSATNDAARKAEGLIRGVAEKYGKEHPDPEGKPRDVLQSVTTFVGGGGPRFWYSVSPEPRQQNYAQLVLQLRDKHDTPHFVEALQTAVSGELPGVRFTARELENGTPTGGQVLMRLSGEDIDTLRAEAAKLKAVFHAIPEAERVQDDWGVESFVVNLDIDPDRASLAGVTNYDVALSSILGLNGLEIASLREGNKQIPIVARLRMEERAQLTDLQNLYVYSSQSQQKVPLRQISTLSTGMQLEKIKRRNQFRTMNVSCYAVAGHLPSEVFLKAEAKLLEFEAQLPPGYKVEVGGDRYEQEKGFRDMGMVMLISIACIFLALVIQFNNAVKPILVFAAIPYGMVGAFAALWIMGEPFGFMGFLGVASLVGVIVSHVIVLFDFIEEEHQKGAPLVEALLDAGIVRLRPVLITVGATVFALFPLAAHGGPLWEPMCYTQIGGLTVATVITLLLVPVLYSIFVLDLKIVDWDLKHPEEEGTEARHE